MLLAATAGLIALGGGISAAVAADSVVTGFGNEVPLSFAVRQIVPPGHEISYGAGVDVNAVVTWSGRSEEHTSELQSLMRISYAVFCLKNKKMQISPHTTPVIEKKQRTALNC